jgi:glycosyltransferase involved in cell wall biosynthesis
MKVLLVAPDLFGPPGGIARHCRLALKALTEDARVQAVDLISLLDDTRSRPDSRYFGGKGRSYWPCGGSRPLLVRRVLGALSRDQYDVVLAGHVNIAPLLLPSAARRRSPRRVTMIYGIDAWVRLPLFRRLSLQHSHRVLAVSDYVARATVRSNQVDPGLVDVIHCCLDPALSDGDVAERAGDACRLDGNALLTVSRLWRSESSKGQSAVLRALPRVLDSFPSTVYWIVGQGDLQPDLQQLSTELGIESHVRFLGSVPDEALRDYYRNCAVYVMPSKWEGFGLAFLEAMAYARPIIGGARDAAPEILGDAALLVDPDDFAQVGEAIVRILSSPELQMRLGRAGRKRVTDHFTYDRFRTRLCAALLE